MTKLSDFESENISQEEQIKKTYESYKNMSQAGLQEELLKEVSKQKANGTFDYNKLASMIENIKFSLTKEQYENIKRILESLK